jgi:hypothetical protein
MKSHLKQAHRKMCKEYLGLSHDSIRIRGVTPDIGRDKFIFAYNAVFCSRSEIRNGIFYSVLQYIGPAADAVKYRYSLEFFNDEYTESMTVTLLPRSSKEDLSEVHNSGNCVKLYPEHYNRFANEKSELAFSIKILTAEHDYPHGY